MSAPDPEALDTLNELIKDLNICMMTTRDPAIGLRARPMAIQHEITAERVLWFFTNKHSDKVDEVQADAEVGLTFADPGASSYVSISGTAHPIRDVAKMRELWNPSLNAWWPDGPDDPSLTLLRVEVKAAEYWDAPHGKLVQMFGFAKALLTGQAYDDEGQENKKLDL